MALCERSARPIPARKTISPHRMHANLRNGMRARSTKVGMSKNDSIHSALNLRLSMRIVCVCVLVDGVFDIFWHLLGQPTNVHRLSHKYIYIYVN